MGYTLEIECWPYCPTCDGYGFTHGHYYEISPETGEMNLRYGIDCTNPKCFAGHVYVDPKKAKEERRKKMEEDLLKLNGGFRITLGDVMPHIFQQIRDTMRSGQMTKI